ncbi:MAG: hypothetical protein DIU63_05830 [Proteobacteria bacterium]|nr:MAG: hypothetical protein DIU63_05830 [Pseudomonadota bacterium]
MIFTQQNGYERGGRVAAFFVCRLETTLPPQTTRNTRAARKCLRDKGNSVRSIFSNLAAVACVPMELLRNAAFFVAFCWSHGGAS